MLNPVSCPECSFENPTTATFCVNCGHDLTRPREQLSRTNLSTSLEPARRAPEAERRFVTVLFADLSGFTALTETHDPEMVRELINTCFDRFVPVIEEHEGVIDQFVGDAIVALYGAPVAHEDDPAQACRTALAMMSAMETLNAERKLNLGLHIGINSGMVLAGGIGSRGRQQYSVLGDAVNMAARLEDAAERGEIFVGAETFKLTREQFEYVARGEMAFKGKSEPQTVWELKRAKQDAPAHRRISTLTPLLGRDRELGLLKRVTRETRDDPAGLRVVSILGDAGLGKSRLVQEWRDVARQLTLPPVQFTVAACAPDSTTRAYALITELASVLRTDQADAYNDGSALDGLLGAGKGAQAFESGDGALLHAQYANALRALIERRAGESTLVLVCEDLHWADALSCQVLERVLAQLSDMRVLIGFTSRVDPETPGWDLMQATEELPGVAALRLHLTPLAENEAHALVLSLLPGTVPPDIQDLILTQAEGNPLFVEELVRMLLDRGDLKREDERWVLAHERAARDVPNTLQGVLMARVDQLPSDARRVLQIASVLGREFSLDVLAGMLNQLDKKTK